MSFFNINFTGEAAIFLLIKKSQISSPKKPFYYLNLDFTPANLTAGWIKDYPIIIIDWITKFQAR